MPTKYKRRRHLKLATKATNKRIAKIAKSVISRRSELKCNQPFSYAGGAAPIGQIPIYANNISSSLLTNIGGGSTVTTRTGNECYLRYVRIRGHIYNTLAATAPPPTNTSGSIRLVVFWDNQPVIGTNAVSGDVLTMSLGTSADFYGTQNWGNRKRFKIIKDKIIRPTDFTANIANNGFQKNLSVILKFKKGGKKLRYQDATGTNMMGPHLYWFLMSQEAADTWRFVGTVQLKWEDE